MKYGETNKWWGDNGPRQSPHEGLDFVAYIDSAAQRHLLEPGILTPPLFKGCVVNIIDDFLGRTIILEHSHKTGDGLRLLSFMAHILPPPDIKPGSAISALNLLGEVAPGNNASLPHLHISTAWASPAFPIADFSWANFKKQDGFIPCDPIQFLDLEE